MIFCSMSNHRWRGASRRPNGEGVHACPVARRGAGQPVIQADGRLLESHAGRAPSIKRRSLTPVAVRLGRMKRPADPTESSVIEELKTSPKSGTFLRDGATAVRYGLVPHRSVADNGDRVLALSALAAGVCLQQHFRILQTRSGEPRLIGDAPISLIPWLLVGIAMLVSSWGLFYQKLWAVWAIRMACIAFALLYLPGFFLPSGIESTSYMWVQVFFGVALAMLAVACIGYLFSRRFTDRLFSDHRQEVGL